MIEMEHLRLDQLSDLLGISKSIIYRGMEDGWIDKIEVRGQTRAKIPQEVRDMEPGDRLLKPREVANILNVTVGTIYRWFWDGKLTGVTLGGNTVRLFESGVKAFISKGEQ